MARAPGGTTCSSSGCGAASNMRRFILRPTIASERPALRSVATWTSTTAADRIRALTTPHPIKPTSPRCHSAWQLNPGRRSTYRRGDSVQTTGTTSLWKRFQNGTVLDPRELLDEGLHLILPWDKVFLYD